MVLNYIYSNILPAVDGYSREKLWSIGTGVVLLLLFGLYFLCRQDNKTARDLVEKRFPDRDVRKQSRHLGLYILGWSLSLTPLYFAVALGHTRIAWLTPLLVLVNSLLTRRREKNGQLNKEDPN